MIGQCLRPANSMRYAQVVLRSGSLVLLLLLAGQAEIYAQRFRASISGTVADPSGASVPNASVTAMNTAQGVVHQTKTDSEGNFQFVDLNLGPYAIRVEAPQFKTHVRKGIVLHVNDQISLPIQLEVGSIQQNVTVSSEAPLLNLTTASLGSVVSNRYVVNLPLNGRNPLVLQTLVAGVLPTSQSGNDSLTRPWDTNEASDLTTNGAGRRSNMVTLNGVYAKGGNQIAFTPSIDAVQEFKVEKNSYDAANGSVTGGTFNIVTKSGTNDLHGTVYEFLRNQVLDATPFFTNKFGQQKPQFKMNQFGATAGGPVIVPKLYNGMDKTFWFFNYEGVRQNTPPSARTVTVPTAGQRSGDFSHTFNADGSLNVIYDPLTTRMDASRPGQYFRTPFPGNAMPSGRINSVAKNVLGYIPLPNQAGLPVTGAQNFYNSTPGNQNYNQWGGRVDHSIGQNSRIFGAFGIGNFEQQYPNLFNNLTGDLTPFQNTHNVTLDFVHNFSASWLMQVNYGFARKYEGNRLGSFGFDSTQLGFPSSLTSQFSYAVFPQFNIADSGGSFGMGGPSYNGSTGHNLNFVVTRAKGRHYLRFGAYLLLLQESDNGNGGSGTSGSYTFNRDWTQADPFVSSTSGYGFATFLLGYPSSGQVGVGAAPMTSKFYPQFFFQDDIKVTSRLSLNLGLRWQYMGPATDRFDRSIRMVDLTQAQPIQSAAQAAYTANYNAGLYPASLVPTPAQFTVLGVPLFARQNGQPRRAQNPELNMWEPRIGLAYRINSTTVWRAGFGIFHNLGGSVTSYPGFGGADPMVTTLDGGLTPNLSTTLSNPFPTQLNLPPCGSRSVDCLLGQSPSASNPDVLSTRAFKWSAGLQYESPHRILFEFTYAGTGGDHFNPSWALNAHPVEYLSLGTQLNSQVPNPFYGLIPASAGSLAQKTVSLSQLLKPYPAYVNLNGAWPAGIGRTSYHSLQTSAERRFSSGYTFIAAFTYSKYMDRNSYLNPGYSRYLENVVDPNDRPYRLVLTGMYELPFGRGKAIGASAPAVLNKLIGGWELTHVVSYQGGAPLSGPGNTNATGQPLASANPSIDQWFNPAAFAVQRPFTLRTLSRYFTQVRYDGMKHWDISLIKNTAITERVTTQFRAEFFNAFNRVQFSAPNTGVTSPTYTQVTSQANIPRQIQFGLKLLF